MERVPDHEVIVDEDDEWRCLTCEAEGAEVVSDGQPR